MQLRLKLVPWFALALALALALPSGCSRDEAITELVISIEADRELRAKLTRIEVESYDPAQVSGSEPPQRVGHETFWIKSAAQPGGVTLPFSFGAARNRSDEFLLVVIGFEDEQAVVEHKARVAFIPGKSGALRVALNSACYQKRCGGERGTSTWLQSSCEGDEGTCSGVMTSPAVVIDEDDAGPASPAGGGRGVDAGAEAGSQSENDGGRAASDGGGSDPMDGGTRATDGGGQQLDTGSSTSDGGAPDTGSARDASSCPANHFQTARGCVPHFTSLSSNGDTVGGGSNCARRADGTVACWGRNISGQFGNGEEEQAVTRPVVISALAQAVEVAVGSNFICHRRADGTVFCSGANNEGALGRGATGDSTVPVQVMGLTGALELAAGYEHICARRSDGTVVCWGNNASGQLGNGMSGQGMRALAPVAVTGLNNVVEIAAGMGHTCARRNASGVGSVVCWGANSLGQLGNGSTTSSPSFVQVTGLNDATALALGEWHSCALRAERTIACWGADGSGQLGNAESETSVPSAVVGLADAVEVAANRFYTCARRMNGSVTCWGAWPGRSDGFGQLVKVESGALEIGAGYFHTCVRKSDGNVVCWGENMYGQIGDGMTTAVGGPYVVTPATVIAY